MANDNMKALEQGMKKARELAEQMLLSKSTAPMAEVVDTAMNAKEWTGFTGNAQTSYGGCVQSNTKHIEYRADELRAPVIRNKVGKGEEVYLEDPYEGEARAVTGSVDIKFANSSEALDAVLSLPMPPEALIDARFAFPLEYVSYLREHYIAGGESPLIYMHQLAPLAFKSIQ